MKNTFYRLAKIAFAYKGWMLFASLLGFLTIGSSIGLLMTSAYIIAKAALHPSIAELQIGIVGVRFFGISRGIFRYLERYISHEATFRLLAKFRVWFYQAIEPLAPAQLLHYKSGDLLNRLVSDVESLEHIYSRVLAPPFVAILISVLMFFMLGVFDFIFSIILLLSFLVAGIGVPLLIHFLERKNGNKIIHLRSQLQVLSIDGIQGMPELLIFGQEKNHQKKYELLNQKLIKQQRKSSLINGLHESLIGLIMNLTVIPMLIIATQKVTDSTLNGIYLSVLILGIMAAFEAITPLPLAAQHLNQSVNAGKRIFKIIDTKPQILDQNWVSPKPIDYSIRFENVSFKYERNNNCTLQNISFTLGERKKIALVGPSGAGKSTIINLLLRLWDFQEGNIFLGEKNILDFNQIDLRNYFSVVTQGIYLFNDTIQENLTLGKSRATDQEIDKIINQVQLQEFIRELPQKYQSWVGEQGAQISGGEQQRIAIARALIKQAPILILDEPTANLDPITEQKIFDNLWQNIDDKTVLLITHKLVGLENVDEILVLKDGQIAERGKHQNLISRNGLYQKMWDIQTQMNAIEMLI